MNPLLLLLLFLLLLMVLGAVIAFVVTRRSSDVDERLEQFVGVETTLDIPDDFQDERSGPDTADRLDKLLSGQAFFGPIKDRISKADVKLRVSEYFVAMGLAGLATAGLAFVLINHNVVVLVVAFVVGMRIPKIYINFAAKKRMRMFDNQLGDTLNLWVNALRSGYSVLQAMETIATELPPPVSKEFERVVQEVRLGLSMTQSLDNMYNRVPSEDLDLVITAVNIQREVGGNLAEVLDTISFTIRERVRIKGEIRTLTAQGRASGWIISILPVVLGLLLYIINPIYVSELWVKEDPFIIPNVVPCGWLVLGLGGIMIGSGAFAISKIVDIEV
ncbi:MAG: type II secretion system F family protein [Anaerolineae bacterium]